MIVWRGGQYFVKGYTLEFLYKQYLLMPSLSEFSSFLFYLMHWFYAKPFLILFQMLDDNNHLIQCIMDSQNKGKTSECSQ